MDLHSGRSQVDFAFLAGLAGRPELVSANTALEVLEIAGEGLAATVAGLALDQVRRVLGDAKVVADVMIVSRHGRVIARAE